MLMRMIKCAKVRGFPKYITKLNKFYSNEIAVFKSNNYLPIITFWYLIRCKLYANTRLLSPMSFPLFYFGHNDYLCTNEHKIILFVFEYLYLSHAIIVNKISYFWMHSRVNLYSWSDSYSNEINPPTKCLEI